MSLAQAQYSIAQAQYSIAQAQYSIAQVQYSFAQAQYSIAQAQYSIAQAQYSIAQAQYPIAQARPISPSQYTFVRYGASYSGSAVRDLLVLLVSDNDSTLFATKWRIPLFSPVYTIAFNGAEPGLV